MVKALEITMRQDKPAQTGPAHEWAKRRGEGSFEWQGIYRPEDAIPRKDIYPWAVQFIKTYFNSPTQMTWYVTTYSEYTLTCLRAAIKEFYKGIPSNNVAYVDWQLVDGLNYGDLVGHIDSDGRIDNWPSDDQFPLIGAMEIKLL